MNRPKEDQSEFDERFEHARSDKRRRARATTILWLSLLPFLLAGIVWWWTGSWLWALVTVIVAETLVVVSPGRQRPSAPQKPGAGFRASEPPISGGPGSLE